MMVITDCNALQQQFLTLNLKDIFMIKKLMSITKRIGKTGLLKITTFLFLIIFADAFIGGLLQHFYFTMKSGTQFRTTFAMEKTEAEVIIMGSSKAVHSYSTIILQDKLKATCYNAGRDGEASSLYHYAILEAILKRYHPKMVVLDLMIGEFGNRLYTYDKLATLSPYYETNPEIRPIINLRSGSENFKLLSHIYPFNSLIMAIISGNIDVNGTKNLDNNGYIPLPSSIVITQPKFTFDKRQPYALDTTKIKILNAFIEDCLKAKVQPYLIVSPTYENYTGVDPSITKLNEIANYYHIPFFNFLENPFFLDHPLMFADPLHLNESGAKIFSNMISDSIILAQQHIRLKIGAM